MVAWRALALVALAVSPVLAFQAGGTGGRASSAAVAADSAAFLRATSLGPAAGSPVVLNNANNFEANALTVRHDYATGTRLALTATLATNPGNRFAIPNPTATLTTTGAAHTFRVEDTAFPHSRTCAALAFDVTATVTDAGGTRRGKFVDRTTVHVRVGNNC